MTFLMSVFQTILLSSLVIGLVWLVSKVLGKRIGYGWRKLVWLVLAIRLLVPVPIQLSSLSPMLPEVEISVQVPDSMVHHTVFQATQDNIPNAPMPENKSESDAVSAQSNASSHNDTKVSSQAVQQISSPAPAFRLSAVQWLVIIWAAGAVAMLGLHVIQYRRMKKTYLGGAAECEDSELREHIGRMCREMGIQKAIPIRVLSSEVSPYISPMVFGYLRTYLLLPNVRYSYEEMDAIGRHELVHYRQKDLWYKLLMLVVCDIYWFNPLLRLMKHMAFFDVEYVCDQKATSGMNLDAKKDYSGAILKTLSGSKNPALAFSTQFSGSKKNIRDRFENIFSSYNRKMGIAMLCAVLLMLSVGTACVSLNAEDGTPVTTEPAAETTEPAAEETTVPDTVSEKEIITIDCSLIQYNPDAVDRLREMYPEYEIIVTDIPYLGNEDSFEKAPTIFESNSWGKTLKLDRIGARDITVALEKRGWFNLMDDSVRHFVMDGQPNAFGIPLPGYGWGLILNVELFRQAGLVDENGVPIYPKTWDEFIQTAVTIQEKTDAVGFCLGTEAGLGPVHYTAMAMNFGVHDFLRRVDDEYMAWLNSDEAIACMEFIRDLKWKYDVVTEDPNQEDYNTCLEHIANGTAAMCIGATDMLPYLTSLGMDPDNIAMCGMPTLPGGVQYTMYTSPVAVFSQDATDAQVEIGLDLIDIMGYGPTENAKTRIRERIASAAATGAPVIPEIHVWNDPALLEYEQSCLTELSGTNQALFQPFFDAVYTPHPVFLGSNLASEPWPELGTLHYLLGPVLQEVVRNPDADIPALMERINQDWESMLNFDE